MPRYKYIAILMILVGVATGGCGPRPTGDASSAPGNPSPTGSGQTPTPGGNPPGGASLPGLAGTVKSVSGNRVEVTDMDGKVVSVETNNETVYQKMSMATGSDLKTGDTVMALGEQGGSELVARSVLIDAAGNMPGSLPTPAAPGLNEGPHPGRPVNAAMAIEPVSPALSKT